MAGAVEAFSLYEKKKKMLNLVAALQISIDHLLIIFYLLLFLLDVFKSSILSLFNTLWKIMKL